MRRIAAVLLPLLLTACSAQTVQPPPATPSVVPLPVARASTAALTLAELPKGFDAGVAPDPSPTPDNGYKYSPDGCWIIRDPFRESGTPTTALRAHYFTRDKNFADHVIDELIYSWPTPQLPLLQRVRGAVNRCGVITGTYPNIPDQFHIGIREENVPGLKDGTLLLIGDPASKPFKPGAYYGLVVRGGTVLTLHANAEDYPTTAAFTAIFLKAVAHLDAVVN